MTSIGTLFAFVIVCGGVWIMRRTQPNLQRPFKTPLVPLVPILGMVWNFAMMYSLGPDNWTRLIVWLVIGQVIFFAYGRRHSFLRGGKKEPPTPLDRVLGFANLGFLAGGAVGYLTRTGNAGFESVIARGGGLADAALKAAAQSAFDRMVIAAVLGTLLGAAVGYASSKISSPKAA
jgi:hypothetical protein